MLKQREVILFGLEPSYQGSVTLAEADHAILVSEPSWAHEGLQMNERNLARPSLGGFQSIYGGALKAVSFTFELKGSGAAGTAADWDPIFQCAGIDETTSAGVSNTYAFISSGIPSGKMQYYQDGFLHTMTGCRTTSLSLNFPVSSQGGVITATATIVGHISAEANATLVSPTVDGTVGLPFKGATFAIGGYSPIISTLTVDLGIKSVMQPNPNSADGYGEILVTGRKVTGTFDPAATLTTARDWLGIFRAGTAGTMATGTIGATAGNRIALTLSNVTTTDVSDGERDGVTVWSHNFEASDASGNDGEFSLVVT